MTFVRNIFWKILPVAAIGLLAGQLSLSAQKIPADTARSWQMPQLPTLKADPAVQRFSLPNGIQCYFAVSSKAKGLFDAALVQKVDGDLQVKERTTLGRDRFSRAKISDVHIEEFLARNGIAPDAKGFVFTAYGTVGYKFSNVSSAYGTTVRDSLLFALLSIARLSAENGTPTTAQAICLSGDFDAAQVRSALSTLSMIIPPSSGEVHRSAYVWDPDKVSGTGIFNVGGDTPGVIVKWHGARVPDRFMQTVLPVVSDKMSSEMGVVLKNRLYPIFRNKGLHVWIDWSHIGSSATIRDEIDQLRIYCPMAARSAVRKVLTEELKRLAAWGVPVEEYCFARDINRNRWMASAIYRSNLQMMQKCACNFIYGSSLATENEKMNFAYRDVADSVSARLFNRYMQTRICSTSVPDSSLAPLPVTVNRDSIAARIAAYARPFVTKLPPDKIDKASGGTMWRFSNGVNVICCKCATDGMIHYCYALKGTRKYADRDFLCCIDGVPEEQFNLYLASKGIVMNIEIGQTDVRLSGCVPEDNFDDLLLVLGALSSQSENAGLCGPQAYKLLVLSTDCSCEKVKKDLSRRILGLQSGGSWRYEEPYPSEVLEQDNDGPMAPDVCAEWFTLLDKSASSNALVALAREALAMTLAEKFSGKAVWHKGSADFANVGGEGCKIKLCASQAPIEGFSIGDYNISDEAILQTLRLAVNDLAAGPLSARQIAVCRQRALNAFESFKNSPEYPIRLALDRHLDNRDLLPRFKAEAEGISPATLQALFTSLREL